MQFRFSAPLWHWRGPAPYHFLTVPDGPSAEIAVSAAELTYGWGMVPVRVEIGRSRWATSLWPKNGGYVLPIKAAVRKAEQLDLDDVADVLLVVEAGRR